MKNILILLILLLASCGSRKVAIETKKEEVKTEIETKEASKVETETRTDLIQEEDELELVPIDETKPSFFEGKEFKNLKIVKRKKTAVTKENKKVIEVAEKEKKYHQRAQIEVKHKETERKLSVFDFWWIIPIIILLYLYRKYRNIIKLE